MGIGLEMSQAVGDELAPLLGDGSRGKRKGFEILARKMGEVHCLVE
jgi:hypothetical protein